MNQKSFENQYDVLWTQIDKALENKKQQDSVLLSEQYMILCQHLALAKQRMYDTTLLARLNKLVLGVYLELYRYQKGSRFNFFVFIVQQFPLAIYRHRFYILFAFMLFMIPTILMGVWTYFDELAIYSFLDGQEVRTIEQMYDEGAEKFGRERESEDDIFMFGFYIMNNIGVAFRCFAGGLLAGIGSAIALVFNGLHLGGVSGHLFRLEYYDTFFPFIITHASFELTAIIYSGAAGLKLGYSIINPKQFTRLTSLKIAGQEAIVFLYGIILMLIIAAFIEAFWSSSSNLSVWVKYSVGSLCWFMVIIYSFTGKRFESR